MVATTASESSLSSLRWCFSSLRSTAEEMVVVVVVVVVVVLSVSNIDGRFVSDDDDDFLVDFVSTDCCGFICVDGCVSLDDDDGAGCGFFFLDFRDFFFADIDDANDDDDDDGGCCGLCGCGGNDTGGCCGGCCCA